MPDTTKAAHQTNASRSRPPAILRVSAIGVAGLLSLLTVTAVAPPLIADQSDRAVVNAPVTLLTSPIYGEIISLNAVAGGDVQTGNVLAQVSNARLDRGTLITLEQKSSEVREKLEATRQKKSSDDSYVARLDAEIANQAEQLTMQFQSQIAELRARVAESNSLSAEKKALVDRQTSMVERNTASMDMLRPTTQLYSAALHKIDADNAKLNQKVAQLQALRNGIYVGDDLVAIGALAQKRRDVSVDSDRMGIEEKELASVLVDHERLIDTERKRLDMMSSAEVKAPANGHVLTVGTLAGRHVNAGDAIASLVDCSNRFIVAIFSYRQGQSMKVGTRVRVEGANFGTGVVTAVLPKTSDKVDERFAIPFPQTERRELYAIVKPDASEAGSIQPTLQTSETTTPCTVGQWVTVTKENGIVPSISVTWRRLETLVTSLSQRMVAGVDRDRPTPSGSVGADDRATGQELLGAAIRSTPAVDGSEFSATQWKRTNDVVSR